MERLSITLLEKRPVIIKRTFRDVNPLSPDELVGLAMEAEVDSRLPAAISRGSPTDRCWQRRSITSTNPSAALMQPFRRLPGPHPDLLQVDPFEAIIDEQMEPGHMLYIPPGFPHEGYALENTLNYSVGFREPSSRELVSGFADYMLAQELCGQHYSDDSTHISPAEVDALRVMSWIWRHRSRPIGRGNL